MLYSLSEDEGHVYTTQKHWFVLFLELLPVGIAYLILLTALLVYIPAGGATTSFLISFVTFFFWLWGWMMWIDYYLDIWVITTKRVIHFNQRALFNRDVKEVWLDRVQDVTVRVEGLLPSLLRYGSVRVQTASETQGIILRNVPEAYRVQEVILHSLAKYQAVPHTNSVLSSTPTSESGL